MNRRQFLTAVAATTPVAAGCLGDGGGDTGGQGQQMQGGGNAQVDRTIAMKNTAFQTLKAEVTTGATVEWVNEDASSHTVTSAQFDDGAASWDFDERVAGGESTRRTFEEAGVYEYYCTIHGKSTMCGAVLVGGETVSGSLPCEDGSGGGGGYGGNGGSY